MKQDLALLKEHKNDLKQINDQLTDGYNELDAKYAELKNKKHKDFKLQDQLKDKHKEEVKLV